MATRHSEARKYEPATNIERVEQAARNCRFKVVESSATLLRLRVGLSWASWGEKIEVSVTPAQNGAIVEIRSESVIGTTLADWGKNRKNVLRLFDELDGLAGYRGVTVACCGECGYLLAEIPSARCPECGHPIGPGVAPQRSKPIPFRFGLAVALIISAVEVAVWAVLRWAGSGSIAPRILGSFGVSFLARLIAFNVLLVLLMQILDRWWQRLRQDR